MRWTAVVNPAAGRGRAARLLPQLAERLRSVPRDVEVHTSRDLDHGIELARAGAVRGDALVACGGDGTVAVLAGVAAEHGVPLAIVPVGAGNDFARVVGLDPRHPLDAVELLVSGVERRCDLGRAGGRWFTSVANTGFDSEANRWANTVTRVRGTPLYVLAVLRTLVSYRPQRFGMRLDDAPEQHIDAWMVAIGNGSTYAGGMRIAPAARLDDGLLDVTVITGAISRAEFLWSFPRVFAGSHVAHPGVATHRARRIEIRAVDDPRLELYAAGERVGRLPVTVEVVPGAVRLVVPPGASGAFTRP